MYGASSVIGSVRVAIRVLNAPSVRLGTVRMHHPLRDDASPPTRLQLVQARQRSYGHGIGTRQLRSGWENAALDNG
jgi:hypothetical protein